jgi:iron complex outermembrane recepter protein
MGSTYRLSDHLSVYAGYNTGFDVEGSAAARSAAGIPLKPEESSQVEWGLRASSGTFSGSISAFEIRRTNALTTDPLNPDFSINVGEQRVRGFEVEGRWAPAAWWALSAGYAYLDSQITKSNDGDQGLRIGDVPKHSVTARTEIHIPGTALTVRGGINHVSNRLLVNGSNVVLPSYMLADIGAGYRMSIFRVDLTLKNLFDERYFTASGNSFAVYPGDPRTVSLRFGVDF